MKTTSKASEVLVCLAFLALFAGTAGAEEAATDSSAAAPTAASDAPDPAEEMHAAILELLGEEDPCDPEIAERREIRIQTLDREVRALPRTFNQTADEFLREANAQTAICENETLRQWRRNCRSYERRYERALDELRVELAAFLIQEATCVVSPRSERVQLSRRIEAMEENAARMERRLDRMNEEYAREGCDDEDFGYEDLDVIPAWLDPAMEIPGGAAQ